MEVELFPTRHWALTRVGYISETPGLCFNFVQSQSSFLFLGLILSLSGTNLEEAHCWSCVLNSLEMGRIWWKLRVSWKGPGNSCIYVALCEFGGRDRGKINGKDFILSGILLPLKPSKSLSVALCIFIVFWLNYLTLKVNDLNWNEISFLTQLTVRHIWGNCRFTCGVLDITTCLTWDQDLGLSPGSHLSLRQLSVPKPQCLYL